MDPDYKRRDVLWRQVLGYTQRFVPACYAQAFIQGLWDLVATEGDHSEGWRPEALVRSLIFTHNAGSYFSASSLSAIRSGLGFDFAIFPGTGDTMREWKAWWGAILHLKTFIQQKQQVLRTAAPDRMLVPQR